MWPSTEAQEKHNAYVEWQLRQRDEFEEAREEREERNRSYAIPPHAFDPRPDGIFAGHCKRCDSPEHGLIHYQERKSK